MTIKEISVEERFQTFLQKKKNLSQIVFFNTVSQSDQYYRKSAFKVIESRNCWHLKMKTPKKTPNIMTNFIGLPRPFY